MITKKDGIVLRKIGHVMFLIDPRKSYNSEKENLIQIDDVGEIIWEEITGCVNFNDIVNRVALRFSDEKTKVFFERVKEDVKNFLFILAQNELIRGDEI